MSVLHDVHCGLVPPVQHHHCQDVPHLVARAEVVQLACGGEQGHSGIQLLNSTLYSAISNQSFAELCHTLPLRGDRESSLTNLMEVVCLFPLFYSVWEHGTGNVVSLFSARKFRTRSMDCDTVGSLTEEKKTARREFPTWEVSFWNFGNIEEKSDSSDEVHDKYPRSKLLQKKSKLSYSVRRQKQKKMYLKIKKEKA